MTGVQTCALPILAASSFVVAASCLAGNVLTLVSLKLGAQELFLGVLSFLAFAPGFCSVFTMSAIERIGKRRVLLLWHSVAVIFVVPFLLLPILAQRWPAKACLALILIATSLRTSSDAMGATGWFPLLQDVVPSEITGRFFARMRTYWQSAGLVTMIFAAWLLWDKPQWWKFEVLFAIAMIGYLVRIVALAPMVEKPPAPEHISRRTVL